MPIAYIVQEIWRWIAETGINLALLVLLAFLIPRAGRFANRMAEKQVHESGDTDEGKTRLAIAGVGINVAQIVAFFLLLVFFLQQIGFSLVGATLPATVVSAAIGFGAQSIIADFLAGFFILTEKQYGVGDFVTFEGNGVEVSGDVIQITMRSTHIRTIEQSTVSIPNSTARICINHSNYWSSALVVIPVPLLGSTSADEATARAERAARKALSEPDIAKVTLGELSVHPAVAVTPPVVVGMPWTMDVRFLVRVEPLSQWMVERAIRIAVLNEFWEEYGSAPTTAGTRLDRVIDHTSTDDTYPPTEFMRPVHTTAGTDTFGADDTAETELLPSAAKASNDGETELLTEAGDDPAADPLDTDDGSTPEPRRAFGGVMRLSTGVLLAMFAVLLLARGLTLGATDANPDQSGVLAPPPRTTVTSPTATEPAPAPSTRAPAPTATSTREGEEETGTAETPGAGAPSEPVETPAETPAQNAPAAPTSPVAPAAPTAPATAGAPTAGAGATATPAPR